MEEEEGEQTRLEGSRLVSQATLLQKTVLIHPVQFMLHPPPIPPTQMHADGHARTHDTHALHAGMPCTLAQRLSINHTFRNKDPLHLPNKNTIITKLCNCPDGAFTNQQIMIICFSGHTLAGDSLDICGIS